MIFIVWFDGLLKRKHFSEVPSCSLVLLKFWFLFGFHIFERSIYSLNTASPSILVGSHQSNHRSRDHMVDCLYRDHRYWYIGRQTSLEYILKTHKTNQIMDNQLQSNYNRLAWSVKFWHIVISIQYYKKPSDYFDCILLVSFIFNNFLVLTFASNVGKLEINIFTLVTERQIFPSRLTVINALSRHVMTF